MANLTDLNTRISHRQDQNLHGEEDSRINTNTLEKCLDGRFSDKIQNIPETKELYDRQAHTWEMVN
uniref:Putative ovule protein n=1 Tax=Solanum chacoense TaxID=4108 RepID=A0A0V0HE20_SOLCH